MTPENYERVQEAFLVLRELPPAEREERLAAVSDQSPEIIDTLRQLLDADKTNDSFLHQPLVDQQCDPLLQTTNISSGDSQTDDHPETIGPYRLLQKIGEGGHGLVFMAEQVTPIRRKVAIKWIKPGMDSNMVLARFEAERQALAMMSHPSIANVVDAGQTAAGQPYFVMELVHGIPIDEFCSSNELTLLERLRLFCQVCDAVHHAHRKGIIHRDVKPSNVLVTVESGAPLAKVIDFGIAKALHMPLTDKTMYTEFGQIIGTLEYMSPEQAMMSQSGIDVRSDVYSLGVLLYLLLTGETPLSKQELLKQGIWELRTVLQEVQPQTPSVRITQGDHAQRWRDVTQSHAGWLKEIAGDLDWITMKALAKEPVQRYDSAAALAEDVDNYLNGRVIVARPPSRWYTFQKWFHRHRVVATISLAIIACMLVSILSLSWAFAKSQENLLTATDAQQAVKAKAEQLQLALATTQQEKTRADRMLQRQLMESAWKMALDGDQAAAMATMHRIQPSEMSAEKRFVKAVAEQMELTVLRPASAGTIRNFAIHRQSGEVAVINAQSQLETYSTATGQQTAVVQLPVRIYSSLQFSTDGMQILISGADTLVRFDRRSMSVQAAIAIGQGSIRKIAHDRTHKQWVITTAASRLVFVNETTLAIEKSVALPTRIADIAVSENGDLIAVAALDGRLFVVRRDSDPEYVTISRPQTQVTKLRFDKDRLLIADYAGAVQSLIVSETSLAALLKPDEAASGESVAPEIAAADIQSFRIESSVTPTDIDLIIDGSAYLAVNGIVGWQSVTGDQTKIREFSQKVRSITAIDETNQLLIIHPSGQIAVMPDAQIARRTAVVLLQSELADGVPVDGTELTITAHADGSLRKWNRHDAMVQLTQQTHHQPVFEIDVDPEHRWVASMGGDRTVVVSDVDKLQLVASFDVGWGVRCTRFSGTGELLAAAPNSTNKDGLQEGTVDLWDVNEGQPVMRLAGHQNWVTHMQFSDDDSRLATLSVDETARVWSTKSGMAVSVLDLIGLPRATTMTFQGGGEDLFVGHEDGSVTYWDANSGTLLQQNQIADDAIVAIGLVSDHQILVVSKSATGLVFANCESLQVSAALTLGADRVSACRFNRRCDSVQLTTDFGRSYVWNW